MQGDRPRKMKGYWAHCPLKALRLRSQPRICLVELLKKQQDMLKAEIRERKKKKGRHRVCTSVCSKASAIL